MSQWEVGSEFEWSERFVSASSNADRFPGVYELFSTGTACLKAIYSNHLVASTKRPKIHLPSFYCLAVARALAIDFDIAWYHDMPSEAAPDLESIDAEPEDYLLILNTFGLREQSHWTQWMADHPEVITIEDHSHDPFSAWALTSTADYAFASLRKTLPIPDGGMLYSPEGHTLPRPCAVPSEGAAKRLAAMLLKNAFLRGCMIEKDVYRQLETASQLDLESESDVNASTFTRNVVQALDIDGMRQRKNSNIDHFLDRASRQSSRHWSPLFPATPSSVDLGAGGVPLNVVVTCATREARDSLRTYLIERNVFTAIHWSLDDDIAADEPVAKQLAARVLTVPLDFRYGTDDVDRVFEMMLAFGSTTNCAMRLTNATSNVAQPSPETHL